MGAITAICSAIGSVFGLIGGIFKRKNDPDEIAAKEAEVSQRIEQQATTQEQAEEKGDEPIEIK